jgi:cell division protein FtsA
VRAAFEAVPWVRRAVVRREFPNRLRVVLQEHQAVAYWGGDGELRLINSYGEVFEANVGEVEQDTLPRLSGPEGHGAEVLAMYRTLVPLFTPLALSIDQLELSVGGSWRVILETGAEIELGRGGAADITARVQRFLATVTQVTSRYGGRPVPWSRPICGTKTATPCVCVESAPRSLQCHPGRNSERRNQQVTHMAKEYKDLVVGLDIGTAKVMVVVAEVLPGGELKLAGLGVAPSNGIKRGVVVNIDATVQSIQQALREAELMADCKITRVYTGITGSHIRGINSSGMVAVKDREVTAADVARVVETAKAINISTDQRLLLVEPQEFIIDGQDVKEPIGMSGIRLEAKVHIVTGAQSAAENIIKCVRRCGLEVEQLMLNPLASSLSVLTEDERELGVALVDIGAGTTDIAIFTNGAIRHTAVIPIAGDLITSDIAMALRTPTKDAEDIKVESGHAKQLLVDPETQVEVPGLGDRGPRMLSRQALAGVIEPRIEEIFSLVNQVMRESGYEEVLSSGIVLTGGSCIMPGMVELGEDIFLKPVRRGIPKYSSALADMVAQPRAATVMGCSKKRAWRAAGLQGVTEKWIHENSVWIGQRLVHWELLTMQNKLWLARGSPHWRWRNKDQPTRAGPIGRKRQVLKISY